MKLSECPLIGFDTETTGVHPSQDRIVTAALVTNDEPRKTRSWLINPGIEIPRQAQEVHGISTQKAREEGEDPALAIDQITHELTQAALAGYAVVVFNASFDLPLLEAEARRYGITPLRERINAGGGHLYVVDPLVIDRGIDRYRKGRRTLGALTAVYGVETDTPLHDAFADVVATLKVFSAQCERSEQLMHMECDRLYSLQEAWHRAWARNFNQWLAARGKSADVSEEWPFPQEDHV